MRFANKVAIVTGGGGEIGRAIALRLAREGAAVTIADIQPENVEHVTTEISINNGQALAWRTDVSTRTDVEAMVEATLTAVWPFGYLLQYCRRWVARPAARSRR